MKRNSLLLSVMAITAVLLIGFIVYNTFSKADNYTYFTGLGSEITLAPDDQTLAFSYYENGQQSIYTADVNGKNVKGLIQSTGDRYNMPRFSPDGKGIIYLSAAENGVKSLRYMPDINKKDIRKLTADNLDINSTAFSPDGKAIYFSAMPESDYHLLEGEAGQGSDLYMIKLDGSGLKKLTSLNAFSMSNISVSSDGQTVYYTAFNGNEGIYGYNIKAGKESLLSNKGLPKDIYNPVISTAGNYLAYTAVTKASEDSNLYEYELYLYNTKSTSSNQLTNYKKSISSVVFFNNQDRLLFLAQKNWPKAPAKYEVMTVDYNGKDMKLLKLDNPEIDIEISIDSVLNRIVTAPVVFGLYVLLFGLWTVYMKQNSKSIYKPAKISAIVSGATLLGIFVSISFDPWLAIALMMVFGALVVATLIIFGFAYILLRFKSNEI